MRQEPASCATNDRPVSVIDYWDNMYRDHTALITFGGGRPSAEVVEAAGRLPAGARAIDIGCGDGRNSLYLAEYGCCVTAIDISPVGVATTRQFAAEHPLPPRPFAIPDTRTPIADQKAYFIGLFKEDELLHCCAGWEVVSYRKTQFHDEHPGGIRHHHAGETVLASKE